MSQRNLRWQISVLGLLAFFLAVDGSAKTAEDWYREGVELSLDGSRNKALHAFLEAIAIKPQWAEAHHALGVQYFKMDSGLQGITHLRKAARYYRNRPNSQAKKNLAIVEKNLQLAYTRLKVDPGDFDTIEFDPGFTTETLWQTSGIGFFIGDQGHLLTTYSNLEDAQKIRVRFTDGKHHSAKLIKSFVVYDVAILQLENSSAVPQNGLTFGNSLPLRKRDSVYWVDLKTDEARMIRGPVLEVNALEDNTKMFHLGISLGPGRSGGPVLNEMGEVIGMAFSRSDIETNFVQALDVPKETSFALKSSYLQTIASPIIKLDPSGPGSQNQNEGNRTSTPKFHLQAVAKNVVSIETSQTP